VAEELTPEQRNLVARLSSAAVRLARTPGSGDPVAQLRDVSDDPMLLGLAAAISLVELEHQPGNERAARALQLLHAAGADETVLIDEAVRIYGPLEHTRPVLDDPQAGRHQTL
jgi:hypothetical protein